MLCEAKDQKRFDELTSLLRAVISDELEETRTRTAFLRQQYLSDESKGADQRSR